MIRIISSPYDLGRRDAGMGAGATAFLDAGAKARLQAAGMEVDVRVVDYDGSIGHEAGAAIEVNRRLAVLVATSLADEAFPLVLGGNCNICLGMMAGIRRKNVGMVWLDAHGDFHSTDTTTSGFFDGFPLSMVVGRSWKALARTIAGFDPIDENHVLLCGNRDIDPGEDELIASSQLRTYDLDAFQRKGRSGFRTELERLAREVDAIYLHVDLDVIDGDRFRVNTFAPGGGLDPELLLESIDAVAKLNTPVVGASLNCYDPAADPRKEALAVGLDVLAALAQTAPRLD